MYRPANRPFFPTDHAINVSLIRHSPMGGGCSCIRNRVHGSSGTGTARSVWWHPRFLIHVVSYVLVRLAALRRSKWRGGQIYCTPVTKQLLMHKFDLPSALITPLKVLLHLLRPRETSETSCDLGAYLLCCDLL